jgi:hypothetical protein
MTRFLLNHFIFYCNVIHLLALFKKNSFAQCFTNSKYQKLLAIQLKIRRSYSGLHLKRQYFISLNLGS